ncbi:FecR domain-containing protein [Myxococcaceae bacterium JPH2]|nr:FecR domain-containing protein [Myxococcaceae bacterium JPH2]
MGRHETQALWALAADELPPDERARVQAHVAQCADCTQALAQVHEARAALTQAREAMPPVRWAHVDTTLREEAAKRLARPSFGWHSQSLPWALGAACLLALVLWWLPHRAPSGAPIAKPVRVAEPLPSQRPLSPPPPPPSVPDPIPATAVAMTETESATGALLREVNEPGQAPTTEHALAPGMRLRSGMAVRTPGKSSALLRLPDASRVRVSGGSDVVLAQAEPHAVHLVVREGRLAVQASHAPRSGFTVESAGLRVHVVGTVFSVEHSRAGVSVAVLEGRVRVEVEGQPPRFLGAGERFDVRANGQSPRGRALSAEDQLAFRELAGLPPPHALVTKPALEKPQPASAPVAQALPQAVPVPPVEPSPAVNSAPQAPEATEEFEPYPAASTASPGAGNAVALNTLVPAPSEPPPVTRVTPVSRGLGGLIPGGLMASDADERFLGYARVHAITRTCEGFLVGLQEIAEHSPREEHREQARYLRARCFKVRQHSTSAEDEYRRYLSEFPNGRHASEARAAIPPPAVPLPSNEDRRPATTPPRVTPSGAPWPRAPEGPRPAVNPGARRPW